MKNTKFPMVAMAMAALAAGSLGIEPTGQIRGTPGEFTEPKSIERLEKARLKRERRANRNRGLK